MQSHAAGEFVLDELACAVEGLGEVGGGGYHGIVALCLGAGFLGVSTAQRVTRATTTTQGGSWGVGAGPRRGGGGWGSCIGLEEDLAFEAACCVEGAAGGELGFVGGYSTTFGLHVSR